VPNVYPVDLFEHIWAVDRLERLGISRYFQQEIEECMDYVNRFFFATFSNYFLFEDAAWQNPVTPSNDLLLST